MNSDFLAAVQTLENIKFLNAGSFASSGCKIFRHPAGAVHRPLRNAMCGAAGGSEHAGKPRRRDSPPHPCQHGVNGRVVMYLARIVGIALTVLVASCHPADAAGPYRPFQIGLWSGGAYTDDRTGAFSHCSAGVVYDSGLNLFVVDTAGHGWWLGFTDPHWSLTANASLPVKLRFDGRAPVDAIAAIPNSQLLLVPMPDDSHLIETFKHSSQMTVNAQEPPVS